MEYYNKGLVSMLDVKKIRKDFPMLDNKVMQGHPLVYFDSAATS